MVARFLFLLFLVVFCPATTAQQRNSSIITLGSSLSAGNISYWSSSSGQFAFGFYPKGNGFAVGIWYAKIQPRTVVWTAKRDDPPLPGGTTLLLTSDGGLILQNQQALLELQIVNTPAPLHASSASLLDSGNLVLYNSTSSIIWQSFDFPTDTLLQGQRLLAGQNLISSLSEANHSSGYFQLAMQKDGNLVQYPADGPIEAQVAYWNSGTFTAGDKVSLNLNEIGGLYLLNSSGFNILNLHEGNYFSKERTVYRMTIDANGLLRLYSRGLGDEIGDWKIEWTPDINKCDPKGLCGPNEFCSVKDDRAVCTCFPGFDKIDQEEGVRNLGCKRNLISSLSTCSENNVQEMENIIWLDDYYSTIQDVDKDTCKVECSRDCNCEAAIYKDRQCHKQTLPLRFGRVNPPEDQGTSLIKVGNGNFQTNTTTGRKKQHRTELVLILGLTFLVTSILVLAISGLLIYKFRVRGYKHISSQVNGNSDGMDEDIMLRSFKYGDLEEATNGFEEEVGRGAFATVFKGVLLKGHTKTVIAVKRLEIQVAEGEREFQNEVKIIGRTHHRNLVQLLGYCHEGTNRLLVYEYMSNGSLADFIFKSRKPRWEERMRIVLDIAKGILYLHEECKMQIIHCDIKPENILMDENGSAKIADFGVSKLLMPCQTKTMTRMRGTRGYVAPEWHKNMPVTTKADVYSFGIMLLEIVCCRRSLDMDAEEDEVVLSDWVYDCFEANEVEKVVGGEEVGVGVGEVERVVRVGLWCIQNEPSLRPLIKKVLLMLEGTVEIPIPPSPASFLSSI